MPAVKVPNIAEQRWLNLALTGMGASKIDLFKANHTPGSGTTLSDLTVADYSSYAQQSLTFGTVGTDGGGRAFSLTGTVTFPLAGSGSQTVYGWYITDSGGNLIECRRFDAPITVDTANGVTPFIVDITLREDS